jgi:hypothetical protein
MTQIAAKTVERANARFLNSNVILALQVAGETEAFALKPDQINDLIVALLIASLNPALTAKRTPPPASTGGIEKILTIQLERIAASHAPAKGTVSSAITLPSGFRVAFEMSPQESLALSVELQSAAGQGWRGTPLGPRRAPQFTAGSTFRICLPLALAERVRVPQNAMRPQPNAWLRSTIRSSGSSIPTEMRISAGVIPSRNRSPSGMSE